MNLCFEYVGPRTATLQRRRCRRPVAGYALYRGQWIALGATHRKGYADCEWNRRPAPDMFIDLG